MMRKYCPPRGSLYCTKANVFALLIGLSPFLSHAGVVVGATRFIYGSAQRNGISFSVKNTDALAYLIQAKVLADDGKNTAGSVPNYAVNSQSPFIISPPLFRLKANEENTLRIIRTGGDIPVDHESLFSLTVAAIPEGKPGPNSLQVAIRSRFKLLYRPEGLKGNPSHAYETLLWQRHGQDISVSNPTPYYVTLFQLTVNGKAVDNAGMVAPFSTRTQSWCPASGACELQWQTLNDFGGVMPPWNISPTSTARAGQSHSS